jgi:hypothetical protein
MAEKKPEPMAPKAAELRSVDEWARALGEYQGGKGQPGYEPHYSARHAAACALHGWNAHAHHAGAAMRLSEFDYRAALDAASPKQGNGAAHKPAFSPHCPHSGGLC